MLIIALLFVQANNWVGVASAWEVGFDKGKIIGLVTWRAISFISSSLKASATPETPISTVGLTL